MTQPTMSMKEAVEVLEDILRCTPQMRQVDEDAINFAISALRQGEALAEVVERPYGYGIEWLTLRPPVGTKLYAHPPAQAASHAWPNVCAAVPAVLREMGEWLLHAERPDGTQTVALADVAVRDWQRRLSGALLTDAGVLPAQAATQPERPQGGVVDAAEVFRIAGGDIECCPNPTAAEALACLRDLRECYDEALATPPSAPAVGENTQCAQYKPGKYPPPATPDTFGQATPPKPAAGKED